MDDNKQVVVDRIPITEMTELRVQRVEDENGNCIAVDVRNWFRTQKNPEFTPTQKGIRVKPDAIDRVISAIQAARG